MPDRYFIKLMCSLLFFSCNNAPPVKKSGVDSARTVTEVLKPSVDAMLDSYVELKNALVNEDGKTAAKAADKISAAFHEMDESAMNGEQRKVYADVKEDIEEDAKHIAENAGKIEHQREHFDWLSNAIADILKVVKPRRTLYKVSCLMFNNNKGAIWFSETREIKNPYYGKKMLDCGVIKEVIK